jgi:microcystin-dependent protein
MATPYIGEIRLFAGTYAPLGWLLCDGSLKSIAQYDTLYTLLGTTYGGDGVNTFSLPDLRSRVPVHMGTSTSGTNYVQGQMAGTETVTLTTTQIPKHTHPVYGAAGTAISSPANALPTTLQSAQGGTMLYGAGTGALTSLLPTSVTPAGGSQPHNNLQPYVAATYIIAFQGIYPTRS